VDIWLHSNGFKWLLFRTESNTDSVTWKDEHLLKHSLEVDFGIHNGINHWFIFDVDLNLISKDEASLLVSFVLVADVQICIWDLILNFKISSISSSLLDVFNMVKASNSTRECSSLSVLEVDLNFVVGHTLKHLISHFKPSKGLDISRVGFAENFNSVTLISSTL